MQGGGPPDQFKEALPKLEAAWKAAGRDGEPRKMALGYYSLGPDAERNANDKLTHYYAYLGDYAQRIADGAVKDADSVKQYVAAFEELGCDEFIFFPSDTNPEQVGLLRDALA
jgi:alkanesulfonate monooxygenase SsuD/methylene tetrahydromethanopterin reductase-like flavin-dependent oxidoreductase (luciferase family)